MISWRTIAALLILGGVILMALAAPGSTVAQIDSPWRVDSAEALPFDPVALRGVFPAPDGRHIVYMDGRALCVSDVVDGGEQCTPVPEDFPLGLESGNPVARSLAWSPDSTRVAIVGAPFGLNMDTDLWLLDTRDMALTNLADDLYAGPLDQAPQRSSVISQPTWSPDGTRIAAALSHPGIAGPIGVAQLVVLDVVTTRILSTARFPEAFTLFPDDLRYAPDGHTLAFSLGFARGDPAHGLWFLDTASGERRLMAGGALFNEWLSQRSPNDYSTQIGPVLWSPDGSRLVVWAGSGAFEEAPGAAFVIDAETGELGHLPAPFEWLILSSIVRFEPFQAAWSPDGSALLVAADGAVPRHKGLVVDPEAEGGRVTIYVVDLAIGVGQIVAELPATNQGNGPVEDYARHAQAAWGPDGHAIIAGYALHLARE